MYVLFLCILNCSFFFDFFFLSTGPLRLDATGRECGPPVHGPKTGQKAFDPGHAEHKRAGDIPVRRVRHVRRPWDVRATGLRAIVPVLVDHVFGRHGHANHSVDAGQRDLPERVRDKFFKF